MFRCFIAQYVSPKRHCVIDIAVHCCSCNDPVQRVEQAALGTVFICTHGGTKHGVSGCRRTYLSNRDLQAHIQYRHMRGDEARASGAGGQRAPAQAPVGAAAPVGYVTSQPLANVQHQLQAVTVQPGQASVFATAPPPGAAAGSAPGRTLSRSSVLIMNRSCSQASI